MWLSDLINSTRLFIILNPFESVIFLIIVCTWAGSYLESVFKFWDWGPKCDKCKEWVIWDDCVTHCTSCNNNENAKQYRLGHTDGEHSSDGEHSYREGY